MRGPKTRGVSYILLGSLAVSLIVSSARAENLFDIIALAYQTNPALLAVRADQRALDEKYIQAEAALGPTASLSAQREVDQASVDQAASVFSLATQNKEYAANNSGQLTVNQPLYTRGQLSSAISVARANILQGRQALRQQEAALISQLVTAYADVLLARGVLLIDEQSLEILQAQVTETQAKVDAKALTLTDNALARSRLIAAQVQLTQARKAIADAEAKFQSAVGEPPNQLDPLPDLPGLPPALGVALDAAEQANPQLLTALYTELGSRAGIAQAKAADGPEVGLQAAWAQQPLEPYLAHQNIRSLSVAVVLNTPLFTAGAHQSKVRAAIETNNRDSLKLADMRRQIDAAVVQGWSDLASQRLLLETIKTQLDEESRAFQGERFEEHFGLRPTIELLNAEQELQSVRTSLAQAYHDEYLLRVGLLADVGVLQAELIDPQISPYRPEKSLAQRDLMGRLLPWERLVEVIDAIGAPRVMNASDRDVLGSLLPPTAVSMPPAPRWADLNLQIRFNATPDVKSIEN